VKRRKRGLLWIGVILFPLSLVTSVYSSDELVLKPRVPADKLAEPGNIGILLRRTGIKTEGSGR